MELSKLASREIYLFTVLFLMCIGMARTEADTSKPMTHSQVKSSVSFFDKCGLVPVTLKKAVIAYLNTETSRQQLEQNIDDETGTRPTIEDKANEAAAATEALRKKYAALNHADDGAFSALKDMVTAQGPLDDQLAAANEFVWGYPKSSHLADAQAILKTLLDQQAAEIKKKQDADQAIADRQTYLKKGVTDHNLRLEEWKEFLRGMSQDDVLLYLGPPTKTDSDGAWFFDGTWTINPDDATRVGIIVYFNGTRELNVAPEKSTP